MSLGSFRRGVVGGEDQGEFYRHSLIPLVSSLTLAATLTLKPPFRILGTSGGEDANGDGRGAGGNEREGLPQPKRQRGTRTWYFIIGY